MTQKKTIDLKFKKLYANMDEGLNIWQTTRKKMRTKLLPKLS
jgi:hypothetical protein